MSVPSFTNPLRSNASSTSLAQFYQENNPSFSHSRQGTEIGSMNNGGPKELDFCNAFWGEGDGGYEVIMAKCRASARTIDDLRSYWKERASIEEDYAKRLAKLSKTTIGKDEIGDLRTALDTLKNETDKQAAARTKLVGEIKRDIEGPVSEFSSRLSNLKKTYQASIEKSWKNKTAQEAYVAKARERYEQDCLRINAFTANSSIAQGKELEKIQKQLEKVHSTVGVNEKEYKSYVRVLEETTKKWEVEWKQFCDHIQDLEEERVDFIKDNVWVYANAVSSVCVADDESCERVRLSLEGFEATTEVENFVKSFGTGSKIPDPPLFVDYARGEAHYNDQTSRIAQFPRTTTRSAAVGGLPSSVVATASPVEKEREIRPTTPAKQSPMVPESETRASPAQAIPSWATQTHPEPAVTAARTASPAPASAYAPSIRPPSAFARPGSAIGQTGPPPTGPLALKGTSTSLDDDPIARSLAQLRMDPPPAGSIKRGISNRRPESASGMSSHPSQRGSVHGVPRPTQSPAPVQAQAPMSSSIPATRAKSPYQPPPDKRQSEVFSTSPATSTFTPPPKQQQQPPPPPHQQSPAFSPRQNHRNSIDASLIPPMTGFTAAELARSKAEHEQRTSRAFEYATQGQGQTYDGVDVRSGSRPTTPSGGDTRGRAPSPAFMQAPTQAPSPIDDVIGQYHQAFPGERNSRGPSRANSISSRHSRAHSIGQVRPSDSTSARAPSPSPSVGFAGVGAGGGRSPSPRPPADHSKRLSGVPSAGLVANAGQGREYMDMGYGKPPRSGSRISQYDPQQVQDQGLGSVNSHSGGGQQRYPQSQSPSGYPQSVPANQQQPVYQAMYHQPPPAQNQNPYARTASPAQTYANSAQQQYGSSATGNNYQNGTAGQTTVGYPQNVQAQHPQAQQHQQALQYLQQQQQQSQHQSPYTAGGYAAGFPQQNITNSFTNQAYGTGMVTSPAQFARSPSPSPAHAQAQAQALSPVPATQAIGGGNRTPSPVPPAVPVDAPPTGQYSTTGEPVLFYVKALYDYEAQSETEFDFQLGDIIAVTKTPADGWWSGELLDEARRRPGKTDFPSNFVCLF